MFVDIFDVKLGDKRQMLVTQELLEEEINPKLKMGWNLSGKDASGQMVALSQGKAVTIQQLEKISEELQVQEAVLRSPIVAG